MITPCKPRVAADKSVSAMANMTSQGIRYWHMCGKIDSLKNNGST